MVVHTGKQRLITRGSLATFGIANDVAKYFCIIPAAFAAVYPRLAMLNVMGLHSPSSAILSAVIFNALIIVFLIPLALKGVSYRPLSASAMLRRNLWIYGLGGLLVPFIGIKAIDLLLTLSGLVLGTHYVIDSSGPFAIYSVHAAPRRRLSSAYHQPGTMVV